MTTTAVEVQRRFLALDQADAQEDSFELSFSSEKPVPRQYGNEILSHRPGAVDLARLNDGAPLLFNHNPDELLGVVEHAAITNGKVRARVRWGTSAEAEAKRREVAAGILRNVSIGYSIDQQEVDEDGNFIATRWTPVEISLVSVPADPTVGIGRSQQPTITKTMTSTYEPISALNPDEFGHAQRDFSVLRALKASASGNWSEAGLEREVSQEISHRSGRQTAGFFTPHATGWQTRDYVKGTAAARGNLVETDLLAGSFIDSLRNRLAVAELGATMLPGLVGDVAIPRRTATSTSY